MKKEENCTNCGIRHTCFWRSRSTEVSCNSYIKDTTVNEEPKEVQSDFDKAIEEAAIEYEQNTHTNWNAGYHGFIVGANSKAARLKWQARM